MPPETTETVTSTNTKTGTRTKMILLFAGGIVLSFFAIRMFTWVIFNGKDQGYFPFRSLDDLTCFFLLKGC